MGIALTHGHGDHIGAIVKIVSAEKVPLWVHPEDAVMLLDAEKNLSALIGLSVTASHPHSELADNMEINFGSIQLKVIHTPGHTRGGVCFYMDMPENSQPILFSGDTLFRGDVGRCDLPGGDWDTLRTSIVNRLYSLPDNTVVYPGHGDATTIANEKQSNNYVRAV